MDRIENPSYKDTYLLHVVGSLAGAVMQGADGPVFSMPPGDPANLASKFTRTSLPVWRLRGTGAMRVAGLMASDAFGTHRTTRRGSTV